MTSHAMFANAAAKAGCPQDQLLNLVRAETWLQGRQLVASAAARRCDRADGPTAIGYGGAGGGGKSNRLLAQTRHRKTLYRAVVVSKELLSASAHSRGRVRRGGRAVEHSILPSHEGTRFRLSHAQSSRQQQCMAGASRGAYQLTFSPCYRSVCDAISLRQT